MNGIKPSFFHSQLTSNGLDKFYWSVVKDNTNYVHHFSWTNPDYVNEAKDLRALQIFTQYECRLLEQSVITATIPEMNGTQDVVFSFKWDPSQEPTDIFGSRPIVAIEKETGIKTYYPGIRSVAKVLDMDQRSIKGILNHEGYCRTSGATGKLYSFIDESLPMREGSPHINAHLPTVESIDYSVIPDGYVWAYDVDFNKVA